MNRITPALAFVFGGAATAVGWLLSYHLPVLLLIALPAIAVMGIKAFMLVRAASNPDAP